MTSGEPFNLHDIYINIFTNWDLKVTGQNDNCFISGFLRVFFRKCLILVILTSISATCKTELKKECLIRVLYNLSHQYQSFATKKIQLYKFAANNHRTDFRNYFCIFPFVISCFCKHNQPNSLKTKLIVLTKSLTLKDVLKIAHPSIMEGASCFEAHLPLAKETHLCGLQFYEFIQTVISKSNQTLRYQDT